MNQRLSLVCVLLSLVTCVTHAQFRAGAAQVDITPPDKTPMAGFYAMRPSGGVVDPIFAKAIVIEQDGAKAAFVALDICYTTRPLVVATRKLIAEQTGIAAERVMICATHSHSGPVLARDSEMDRITGAKTPAALEYAEKLPALIARAVAEANGKLAAARAAAAVGREEHLSFNRRFIMKDGTVVWQARLNPNVVRPAGPIDPDVGVWQISGAEGKGAPLATFVNFAMHATAVGGSKVSPDYPGYLAKRLADYYGQDMLSFFANGCCGNINQRDPNWAEQVSGPREGERIGTVLGAAVFRTLPQLRAQKTWAPRAASSIVRLERRSFSAEEIEAARRTVARIPSPGLGTPAMAAAVCMVETADKAQVPLEAEVQVIAVSEELAIVALPGEMFVELGLAIKKDSPFKHTFIAELANGSIGYVPNREAYPQGRYEVVSARCAEGSGERLVEEALKLLGQVRGR